jgi:hypothetical protein
MLQSTNSHWPMPQAWHIGHFHVVEFASYEKSHTLSSGKSGAYHFI